MDIQSLKQRLTDVMPILDANKLDDAYRSKRSNGNASYPSLALTREAAISVYKHYLHG